MLYSSQICVFTHTYIYHNMYIIYTNYEWDTYNQHIFAYTYAHFIWAVVQTCLSFTSESSQRCWPSSDLRIFSDGWCNHHRQGTKSGALWKACADPNDIWSQMRGTLKKQTVLENMLSSNFFLIITPAIRVRAGPWGSDVPPKGISSSMFKGRHCWLSWGRVVC